MDILGRIRQTLAEINLAGSDKNIYARMVRALLTPDAPATSVIDDADNHEDNRRWVYQIFRETADLRGLSKLQTGQLTIQKYQIKRIEHWQNHAARLVDSRLPPVHALWCHWTLLAAERSLHIPADPHLLKRLWSCGFSEQRPDGRLLHWNPDESLDAMVYDELTALHAAYNSAKILSTPDAAPMLEQVRHAVRWHVENTQPDNTTNEPWALAAFAALDDTHTFAEQQLHDTITWLRNAPPLPEGKLPVAIGLLADAAMTLENW